MTTPAAAQSMHNLNNWRYSYVEPNQDVRQSFLPPIHGSVREGNVFSLSVHRGRGGGSDMGLDWIGPRPLWTWD